MNSLSAMEYLKNLISNSGWMYEDSCFPKETTPKNAPPQIVKPVENKPLLTRYGTPSLDPSNYKIGTVKLGSDRRSWWVVKEYPSGNKWELYT